MDAICAGRHYFDRQIQIDWKLSVEPLLGLVGRFSFPARIVRSEPGPIPCRSIVSNEFRLNIHRGENKDLCRLKHYIGWHDIPPLLKLADMSQEAATKTVLRVRFSDVADGISVNQEVNALSL